MNLARTTMLVHRAYTNTINAGPCLARGKTGAFTYSEAVWEVKLPL